MPFVTTLEFTSGDRQLLDDVVNDLKALAERKGVELKGPHPQPPTGISVPQSALLSADGPTFEDWHYTVYRRTIEVVGHDEFAGEVASETYPPRVHVKAEIEQRTRTGQEN